MADWDQDLDAAGLPSSPPVEKKPAPVPLCGPCLAESWRWLDTNPMALHPRLGFAFGSGAVYDTSEGGMRDRLAARHAEWAALVRFQRRLVAEGCRAGRHAGASDA